MWNSCLWRLLRRKHTSLIHLLANFEAPNHKASTTQSDLLPSKYPIHDARFDFPDDLEAVMALVKNYILSCSSSLSSIPMALTSLEKGDASWNIHLPLPRWISPSSNNCRAVCVPSGVEALQVKMLSRERSLISNKDRQCHSCSFNCLKTTSLTDMTFFYQASQACSNWVLDSKEISIHDSSSLHPHPLSWTRSHHCTISFKVVIKKGNIVAFISPSFCSKTEGSPSTAPRGYPLLWGTEPEFPSLSHLGR